jgi:TonB-dependent starch-binding outer membrane protein SusC
MEKKFTIHGKLLKLMRFSIVQLCLMIVSATVALAHNSNAQEILDQSISLKIDNENLKSTLRTIEKVADVSFSYRKGVLDKDKKITLSVQNEKLSNILNQVLQNTNIDYEVIGQQIVLTKAKSTSQVPPSVSEPKLEEKVMDNTPKPAITVTGSVTDEKGEPLVGATIVVKGTTNGVLTDVDGKFSISVPDDKTVLIFQFIGYATQEVTVGNQTEILVKLDQLDKSLSEVVVVGYGTSVRRDILGAVSSVKDKDIEQITPVNTFDAMQGRLAGVQISSNGGPGAGSDIRIRGTSTFLGGVNPLYVVDGQQLENIDNLNPNDIANIEILKDGASAAIYGSKSANGVVIITTKAGKAGDLKLSFDYNRIIGNITSSIPLANTRQRFFYENVRAGSNPLLVPADSLSLLYQISNDLTKLLTRPSDRHQINATLSGGGANSRFYWNTGFLDEQGVIINSSYQRLSSRLKMDAEYKKRLTASSTVNLSYEFQKGLNENTVFQQMVERIPFFPLYEPNGDYTVEIAGRQNPVAEAEKTRRDTRKFKLQNVNSLQLRILDNLSFTSRLGINFGLQKNNNFDPLIVQTAPAPTTGSERMELSHDYLHEDFLSFKKEFGKHKITSIVGWQIQRWNEETSNLAAASFSSDNIETFNNVREINTGNTTTGITRHSNTGFFGDLAYDFSGKYLVKGTLRRDGSSRFGADKRYAVFPSGSIGWRLSGEDFLKNIKSLDNLLIRYSYGVNGNERIGDYDSQLLYRPGARYNGSNGLSLIQLENRALSWESTVSQNLGIDLMLYKNRVNLNVDFWDKTTNDLLYNVPLPEETGFTTSRRNIGSVQNRGIDISLSFTPIRSKDFEWSSNFNISFLKNKVLELADEDGFTTGNYFVEQGKPIGNIFGYRNLGVYQYDESNAYASDGTRLTPVFNGEGKFQKYTLNGSDYTGTVNNLKIGSVKLRGGDIIWDDINKDFNIDGVNDRTVLGNGLPTHFGGFFNEFRYKSVSLSFLFDYNFGNNIIRNYDQQRNDLNSANETPAPERIENAWLKSGDIAEYASLDRNRTQNQLNVNSHYVVKGDYVKWRNIRLNYTLPKSILNKMKIVNRLSLFVSVNNLVTFTNYTGFNPELGTRGNPLQPGQDNLRYPNKRDFIGGLSVQF